MNEKERKTKYKQLALEHFATTANSFWFKSHATNRNGTITEKKLSKNLRLTYWDKFREELLKHKCIAYVIYLPGLLLIYFDNHFLGIVGISIVLHTLIFEKQLKQKFFTKKEIQKGIDAYNSTKIKEAIEIFQNVQNLIPKFADELNDWIYIGLEKTRQLEEALIFIQTHNVTSKRFRIILLYKKMKRYKEAIDFFNSSFSDDDISVYPSLLIYQSDNYYHEYGCEEAIKYLLSKGVTKMFMSFELKLVYNKLAEYFIEMKDYDNAKNLYHSILDYDSDNEEAKIGLDKINNMNNN